MTSVPGTPPTNRRPKRAPKSTAQPDATPTAPPTAGADAPLSTQADASGAVTPIPPSRNPRARKTTTPATGTPAQTAEADATLSTRAGASGEASGAVTQIPPSRNPRDRQTTTPATGTPAQAEAQAHVERRATPELTLVTGAGGWVGRALVERLLADRPDARLRLLVRSLDDVAAFGWSGRPGVEIVAGDITVPADVERFFDGAAGADVIHTAGVIHPDSVAGFYAVNTEGVKHIVTAARRSGIRRLVHISSNSPFGTNPTHDDVFRNDEPYRPYFNYGISKMQGELAVLDAVRGDHLDAVIVRPPWFYGPFQPARQTVFFTMIKKGRFPVIGSGEQRRSMVYIDNLVDGIIAAELTEGISGKGFWIADAEPYSINEIVATVGRALRDEGYPAATKSVKVPGIVGKVAETADKLLQGRGKYNQQIHVLGEMDKTIACDISAARQQLGYEPKVALYEGMRTSIQWCKQNGIEL